MNESNFSTNAMEVLRQRYLRKDDQHRVIESPEELFRRVASHVARAEASFKSQVTAKEAEERFYHLMSRFEFLPNSPTLMNAGTPLGQLAACFVLPVEDSMEGIFGALGNMAKIHQSGGGTGFSFSNLRPFGDLVSATKGRASGPVSFMSVFDEATGVIVQGGRRRGANMGILRCDHPDILEFIEAKRDPGCFTNFNLSVGVTDAFLEAYRRNRNIDLRNPRTGKGVRSVSARDLFDRMAHCAWETGDPGLVFLDEIERHNPLPGLGPIEATNPCGELPLAPYESCNLGSINLVKMVDQARIQWDQLAEAVRWGVRFLDNVIEVNRYPIPEIRRVTLSNRKIGLGVMGFADLLIQLGIPYDSREAVHVADKLMAFIKDESMRASIRLAEGRGSFPNFAQSSHAKRYAALRNATVNSIAPTGTISILAGCSSGIEPLFAVAFVRHVLSGKRLFEMNPLFQEACKKGGMDSDGWIRRIAEGGSIRPLSGIPSRMRRVFATAFDIKPLEHLQIQAAFQKHTDNAVSKTINLPPHATVDDVKKIFLTAHRLRCKGITVYRYGSKKEQVLSYDLGPVRTASKRRGVKQTIEVGAEYSGGCARRLCVF